MKKISRKKILLASIVMLLGTAGGTLSGQAQDTTSTSNDAEETTHVYTDILVGNTETDESHGYKVTQGSNGSLTYKLSEKSSGGKYQSTQIKPAVSDDQNGVVLAAIKPESDVNMHVVGASIDVSDLKAPLGQVYGIYNDQGADLYLQSGLTITGNTENYAGGIYAVSNDDNKKSKITLSSGSVDITAAGNDFIPIKAGKNGEISISNSSGSLTINGNGHTIDAIVAEDGGVVTIGTQNNTSSTYYADIDANGGKALYAKDGGTINVWDNSTYLRNITGDITAEGTGKIVGAGSDGALGFQSGTWTGNLNAPVKVTLSKESWTGDVLNKEAVVSLKDQSVWTGKIVNGSSLEMNSATWNDTNQEDTEIGKFSGSLVRGSRGVIQKTSGNLVFDDYSGNSVIAYSHSASAPTSVEGPEVTVKKAESSSAIALRTDTSGIDLTNESEVRKVLDAMAEKLVYSAYVNGERNLDATAEIAEGLTAGSAAEKIGAITFDKATGRGSLGSSIGTAYNAPITGDLTKDTAYADVAKAVDNTTTYTFNEDTYINTAIHIDTTTPKYGITVSPDANKTIVLDMQGHNLTIDNSISQGQAANPQQSIVSTTSIIYPLNDASSVYIKNPGKIDLSTFSEGFYAGGIAAGKSGNKNVNLVEIDNPADWDHAVKIRGIMGKDGASTSNIFNVNWTTMKAFNHGHIDIKGLVDFYAFGAWNLSAIGDDGWISVGGGKLISENYASIDSYSQGHVYLNASGSGENLVPGHNVLQIGGNMQGSGQWVGANDGGYIDAAFTTPDSWFDGIANAKGGWISIALQNGAQWTNKDGGFRYGGTTTTSSDTESTVEYFYGGKGSDDTGFIQQAQDAELTFNHYKGYTTVYYTHDASDPTKMNGGYTVVENAIKTGDDNAVIAMRTDSSGIDTGDEDTVVKVLNSLANKLVYDGYTAGERNLTGYAQIAEGMTSSSYTKQMDIIFDENTGAGRVTKDPLGQTKTLFKTHLTGDKDTDKEYVRAGVIDDGDYHFTEASVIQTSQTNSSTEGGIINVLTPNAAKQTTGDYKNISIKMDNGLTLDGSKYINKYGKDVYGIQTGNGTKLALDGNLNINLLNTSIYNKMIGILQSPTQWKTPVQEKSELTEKGNVKIRIPNDFGEDIPKVANPRTEKFVGIKNMESSGSVINIDGLVDIDMEGTGVIADSGIDASGIINIKGGKIIAEQRENVINSQLEKAVDQNRSLTAYAGTINVGMEEEEGVLKAGSTTVNIQGNILTMKDRENTSAAKHNLLDGTVNLALMTPDSSWKGVADNAEDAVVTNTETGETTGGHKLGTFNLYLQNGAMWTNEAQGSTYDYEKNNKVLSGKWDGISHVTNLAGADEETSRGIIAQGDTPIEIDHYSGNTVVVYGHNSMNPEKIIGGSVTVKEAAQNSGMTLLTDRAGIDMQNDEQVKSVLSGLAEKLIYSDAVNGKTDLKGTAAIGEGLTSPLTEYKIGDIRFDSTDGSGSLDADSVRDKDKIPDGKDENTDDHTGQNTDDHTGGDDSHIIHGNYETQMMKGTKSALLGAAMMWRSNNNDLQRRMGDVRLGQEESGVWARYVGGKNKFDKQNTYMNQNYDIAQVGYDRKAGDWLVGAALDYGKGDVNYTGGKGKEHMATLALYGTRVSDDGKYFDIIFKTGRLKNEFHVSNEIGNRLSADYHTWGNSLSAEYGKRFVRDNGFYLDPSVELTMGRLNSKDFNGHSDLGDLSVKQHAFDSAIGRIGLGIGRQTERSNAFVKLALAHEFGGNFRTDYYAEDGGLKSTKIDLQDTWLDMEIGGSLSIGRNTYLYGTYTHNFGADMETKWRADVGVRYTF